MSDDLTERLRDRRVCSPAQNSCRNDYICDLAADHIEELETMQDALKELLVQRDVRIEELVEWHDSLEAKLEKAVEALDEAVYLLDPDEKDMMRKAGVYRIVTTLAELKGDTDE